MSKTDIYSPDPESPDGLPPEARQAWDWGYEQAEDIYRGDDPKIVKARAQSAWRCVFAVFQDDGLGPMRQWNLEGQMDVAQVPANFISLGRTREVIAINQRGHQVMLFDADGDERLPHVLWDDDTREAWIFTDLAESALERSGDHPHADEYQKWHRRKLRTQTRSKVFPEYDMQLLGVGDSISYRSDKWNSRSDLPNLDGSEEYYHMHTGNGVRVWVDDLQAPTVVRVLGGMLAMHDKGLIH